MVAFISDPMSLTANISSGKPWRANQADEFHDVCGQIDALRKQLACLQQKHKISSPCARHVARDERSDVANWREALSDIRNADPYPVPDSLPHNAITPCRAVSSVSAPNCQTMSVLASAKEATIALNASRPDRFLGEGCMEDQGNLSKLFSVPASRDHGTRLQSHPTIGSGSNPVSPPPWVQVDALAERISCWPSERNVFSAIGDTSSFASLANVSGHDSDLQSSFDQNIVVGSDCHSSGNISRRCGSRSAASNNFQEDPVALRQLRAPSLECRGPLRPRSPANRNFEDLSHHMSTSRQYAASAPSSPRPQPRQLRSTIGSDMDSAARTFQSFSERSPEPKDCALGIGPGSHCSNNLGARRRSSSQGSNSDMASRRIHQLASHMPNDSMSRWRTSPTGGYANFNVAARCERMELPVAKCERIELPKQTGCHFQFPPAMKRSQSVGHVSAASSSSHLSAANTFVAFRERSPQPRDRSSAGSHAVTWIAGHHGHQLIPVK